MAIPVKINVFEGPLDLLLHLIEKNKIDIYDIPIVEITDPEQQTSCRFQSFCVSAYNQITADQNCIRLTGNNCFV